jgi:BON domain
MVTRSVTYRSLQLGLLASSLLVASGCKQTPANTNEAQTATPPAATTPAPRSDQDIANDIQNRINAESALAGQNIQVSVNNGMATLNGNAQNDASRALASADAGAVTGVRTVINNLTVAPQRAEREAPAPQPERRHHEAKHDDSAARNQSAMVQQPTPPPPAPPQETVRTVPPAAPPKPPAPVSRSVTVDSGTSLPVRMTDSLDSQTAQAGQIIHGTLAADIIADNMIAIPRGTTVTGRVVDAKDAAHFSGSSLLSVELTQVDLKGQAIPISTAAFSQQGKGRGKNTATKAGGGAALGAIIGALAGGGKGAAIGAASGGGLGAGVNAVTRGEQVKIPAETLINFKLQTPVTVTTSRSANGGATRTFNDNGDNPSDQPQQ